MSAPQRDVVICEPVRTAVGGFGGAWKDTPAHVLAASLIGALVTRAALPGEVVDDVILGNCYPSMDAPAIGRVAALDAGLPETTTGIQIDRRCGSGLQAIVDAVLQVRSGASDVVLAGGVESMSTAPFFSTGLRWGSHNAPAVTMHDSLARGRVTAGGKFHPVPGGMLETAENLRRKYSISRAEQDEFALRSHQRAAAAAAAGRFADEIVPLDATAGRTTVRVERDEHVRADSSLARLAALRPVLGRTDPDATVTAGNSSGQNDGAAMCVVTHAGLARDLGLTPSVRLVSWALAGVAPEEMGLGPVPATARALRLAELSLGQLDLIECNEAFAAQVLACLREWEFDDDDLERVNVNGSGISLGHPVGATGARILATLAHELRRRGGRYGLETMCIGGGQGLAAIFESCSA